MSEIRALETMVCLHLNSGSRIVSITPETAKQAAAQLEQLKAENEQLKGSITCGVPLGYHEEEQQMEWCGKLIVTGMCAEHWDEFMQLRAELDETKTSSDGWKNTAETSYKRVMELSAALDEMRETLDEALDYVNGQNKELYLKMCAVLAKYPGGEK
jgi:uncharacterized coiled-coil DUF342 family protein